MNSGSRLLGNTKAKTNRVAPTAAIWLSKIAATGVLACAVSTAYAGAEFKLSDDASVTFGLGLRTSYTNLEHGAPNGSNSNSFSADNTRLYTSGSYGKIIKATLNFDRSDATSTASGTAGLRMIDAIAQFEFNEGFNVWMGRMLPPSDRANLYGPFYTSAWSYPCVVSCVQPTIPGTGRDDGAMVWGSLFDSKLAYSVGAFNGANRGSVLASNNSNKLLYAGRLQYSFWDAETGYYRNGTYLGEKSVFTIGASIMSQSNGVGTAAAPGNLKISNLDLLIEKKLANGIMPTLEGAYYKYSPSAADCGSTAAPAACPAGANVGGGLDSGKGYLGTFALLFPTKIGWGQVQPFIRYQKRDRDVSATSVKATDFGVNYLIKGFNAKISAVYSQLEDTNLPVATRKQDQFILGAQLQY